MALRAIVIGTGWAGEGHTQALQSANVDVVAICGRREDVARTVASRLGVGEVRLDWRSAISHLKPDIVSIATPGGPHREMVEAAAQQGCHIFCDKPMGANAADARAMLAAVRRANVKHAYGATSCLEPVFSVAHALIADGAVGTLTDIDVQVRMGLPTLLPYSWFHDLSQGGGMLNQIFTHGLAQVKFVTDGRPFAVMGEARCLVGEAPVARPIHDFRDWFKPVADINDRTVWRTADADTEYSAIMRLSLAGEKSATARFVGSLNAQSPEGGRFEIYGTKGTLLITGSGDAKAILHRDATSHDWRQVSVPPVHASWWLSGDSNEQHNWKATIQQFVADIRGEASAFYPSFDDGCEASEIIDVIRSGAGWSAVKSMYA